MTDEGQVMEEASLLTDFYSDSSPSAQPLPPDFEAGHDHLRTSQAQTTLSRLKYLVDQLLRIVTSILAAFIPSFIPRWGSSAREARSDRRLSPTAYLDGLRGVAAFIVFLVHFILNWFPGLDHTYGATENDHYFLQLPIIRVFLGGRAAVAAFFVISGYALSYRALTKIHSGNKAEALDTLSSSTFRRCFRIYLPCAVDTFICMLLSYNGMFTKDPLGWNTIPPRLPTFSAQFWDWWRHQQVLMYPFIFVEGGPYSPPYNGHLWTIPLEIRGSFVVYGTVLAVAKLNSSWRMAFLFGWDSYLWYMGKWDLFLFVSGVLLANIDVPRHMSATTDDSHNIPDEEVFLPTVKPRMIRMSIENPDEKTLWSSILEFKRSRPPQIWNIINPVLKALRAVLPYALFIFAMYLLSFPNIPVGGELLRYLAPDNWDRIDGWFGKKDQAWRCLGAVLLATSLSLSPPSSFTRPRPLTLFQRLYSQLRGFHLQALFTNAFVQYLGRISFGLYLMHGPVLFCLGTKILGAASKAYLAEPDLGKYLRFFSFAVVCNTIVVIWAADMFTRCVDERSVRWAAWIAKFMSKKVTAATGVEN